MSFAHLPGAVIPEGETVPAHYGNPFAEQDRLRSGQAFTDLSYLEIVTVTGPDRARWLHNLGSRDFENLQPGESSEVLFLDPNGHIETAAGTVDDGETTWLLVDTGCGAALVEFLNKMKFMMRAEVELRTDLGVIGLLASASAVPTDYVLAVWEDPWPRVLPGGAHYGVVPEKHPAHGVTRTLLIVEKTQQLKLAEQLIAKGMTPAGNTAWEAARVADWRPRQTHEVTERALPHELDWLRTAVHLEKGCYRGQETVAKLVNLGRPPRRLVYLYVEGPSDELPEIGAEVFNGDRKVGEITSVVHDYEEGPVALALVKRNTPVDATLTIGSFVATQEEIVSVEGKSSASPDTWPGAGLRRQRK